MFGGCLAPLFQAELRYTLLQEVSLSLSHGFSHQDESLGCPLPLGIGISSQTICPMGLSAPY
jgi:hypothetical protein